MGAAMIVTAFPVLARILRERGLMRTPTGALAIACAAIDDVTAWCILAVVVIVLLVAVFARTMMLFSTLTFMPLARVVRRVGRLFGRLGS